MSVKSAIARWVDAGIDGETPQHDVKHIHACNIAAIASAMANAYWVPVSFVAGEWINGVENLAAVLALSAVVAVNARRAHVAAATAFMVLAHVQLYWALTHHGVQSGTLLWYLVLVPTPFLIFPRRSKRLATALAAITGVVLVILTALRDRFTYSLDLMDPAQMWLSNTILVVAGLFAFAAAFVKTAHATEDALMEARERAGRLLLNVLPPSIVDRLERAPQDAIADRYDEASVLFADIVGFTPLSARVSALETVQLLNRIFSAFDAICERHSVEKIRTIGDGYMVVAGAPDPREDHAVVLARVALEMRDYVASLEDQASLQVRIGLNSGEIVAGIVGTSRFHYDVWGDTVNVAARMESLGQPGRVQVAQGAWERIHREFTCTSNGLLPVKGKGEMETWFVEP